MRTRNFQFVSFICVLSLTACLGSDHPIRHHRVTQRKFHPGPFNPYGTSSLAFDGNNLWLYKQKEISGIFKTSNFWTNSGRNEMKEVQNFFKRSDSGRDTEKESTSIATEIETSSDKSKVMIKFSGEKYQEKNKNLFSPVGVKSRMGHRTFLNPVGYPKSNETSLWPLTYSPGTVEAAMNNTSINITSQAGKTAFLPCRVGHLGDTQISWIRRRDWHVITSGDNLYTYDQRFSVLHETTSHDWTLHIKWVTNKDEGTYECQVSTGTGIISLFVNLRIITPEAKIIGQGQYHVNRGSTISLTCIIKKNLIPPPHVLWYHNGELLNFLRDKKEIKISTEKPVEKYTIKDSFGPGLNFTEENKILDIKSHLEVESAQETHSGNYSCSAPNATPASTFVFITEGDKIAAVQRIDSAADVPGRCSWMFVLVFLIHYNYR